MKKYFYILILLISLIFPRNSYSCNPPHNSMFTLTFGGVVPLSWGAYGDVMTCGCNYLILDIIFYSDGTQYAYYPDGNCPLYPDCAHPYQGPVTWQYMGGLPGTYYTDSSQVNPQIDSAWPDPTSVAFYDSQSDLQCAQLGPTNGGGNGGDEGNGGGINNGGGSCGSLPIQVGKPVNVATGNMYHEETDFQFSDLLELKRTYNSNGDTNNSPAGYVPAFGSKWSFNFGVNISSIPIGKRILAPSGEWRRYAGSDSNGYSPSPGTDGSLTYTGSGYIETLFTGTKNFFDSQGRLTEVVQPTGQTITLDYSLPNYITIADDFGRKIVLHLNSSGNIDQVTDPAGQIYSYAYNGNNLSSVTFPDGSIKNYGYAPATDLLTSIALNGRSLAQWGYDSNGYCNSSSTDGTDNSITLSYNTSTNTTTTTDSRNNISTYVFQHVNDGIIKTTSVTGNCGCTGASGSYDTSGNILSRTDKNGNVSSYSNYGSKGNPGTITEASGTANARTTSYTYHPITSEPTCIKRKSAIPFGGYSTFTQINNYDNNNLLVKSYSKGNTHDITGTPQFFNYSTSYSYNSHSQVIQKTDPRGKRMAFSYYSTTWGDANHGQLHTVTDSLNQTISFGNYSSGKPGWMRDPNGVLTQNVYDSRGRLIAVTVHTRTTHYGYDAFGNMTAMTLPKGNRIGYGYDGANRLTSIRDGNGNYIAYLYDTEGNRIRDEVHDASGSLKKYENMMYDNNNRLHSVTGFDGYSTVTGYDGNGNVTSAKDKKGNLLSYFYDALNRLITAVQPGNITTSYGYDIGDNVTSLTDGNGHTTGYVYDDMGRLVETDSPDTGQTHYEYDAAGNIVKRLDAKGTETDYYYDALNRVTAIRFPADHTKDITYGYDSGTNGIGRLTSMTDPSGTTAYYYDEYGEVVEEDKTFNGLTTLITKYSYDDNGNLSYVTYPDGRIVHYEYDNADTVTRVWTEKPGTATKDLATNVTHAPFGGIASFTFGNGLTAQRSYDQDYRLTYLKSGPFIRRNYGYDPNGNINGITDLVNSAKSQGFGYDALDRLTSATGAWGSLAYQYDNVGNRTQKSLGTSTTTYSYSSGTNRLSSLSGAESASYGYDANGNMNSDGTLSYGYGLNNRLIQATQGGTVKGQYVYDGLGRRVEKTAGGVTTYFLYDLMGNLVTELDGSGNVKTNRAYLDSAPLARVDVGVQVQVQPSTSSFSSKVCLSWNAVAGAAYYVVCWGDTSGYYPNCSPQLTTTSYCVNNLTGLNWYFDVSAYDGSGNLITQSPEKAVTLVNPNPTLPHYNYNPVLGGQADCGICHLTAGAFTQGFGGSTSIALCISCHNKSNVGHDKSYGQNGHPILRNVTVDASHKWPTLGTQTGMGSDKTYTHLLNGKEIVCMTCHNSHEKPNDPGRSWEYTTTSDNVTYTLQNGGWSYYAYDKPVVYRDTTLWSGPTYIEDRSKYLVPESEYDVDAVNGVIIFHQAQPAGTYIYVTLANDYLRNTNDNNQLCLDCHVTVTHQGNDCTNCHGVHGSDNLYDIREEINGRAVRFNSTTAMGGTNGVCVVCHTTTIYGNATAIAPQSHNNNQECMSCHPHKSGFPTYTTVFNGFIGKLLAFIGIKNAYAAPASLGTYSVSGGSFAPALSLNATVSTQTTQSNPQTVTTDVIYYYHNDHLGTPLYMSDESGNVVWRREQTPYGEDTLQRGTVTENFRMPGQYWDAETSTSNNGFRTYNSKIGSYIEADPIGQAGALSIYRYVSANPINRIDTDGLLDVYYWEPHGSSVGHAAVRLDNGTYISWWPVHPGSLTDIGINHRYLQIDQAYEGNLNPEIIHVDYLDEKAIGIWWKNYLKQHHGYNAATNNCATIAKDALNAGMSGSPNSMKPIWTPADVKDYANVLSWRGDPNSTLSNYIKYVPPLIKKFWQKIGGR